MNPSDRLDKMMKIREDKSREKTQSTSNSVSKQPVQLELFDDYCSSDTVVIK